MLHDEKIKLYETMKTYGGSFVKALAECVVIADSGNFQRLQKAFPEIFKTYGKDGPFQGRIS